MQFMWAGKTYDVDTNVCYDTTNRIKLPDGTILAVHFWLETSPPQPSELTQENYLPGMEPLATLATEI